MCNKNSNSPPDLLPTKEKQGKSKSKSKTKSKQSSVISMSGRPSRKIKTRKKKQKFVSLVEIGEKPEFSAEEAGQQHRQLDLFPLHPENLVEEETERENENQYDNVSLLFDGADNENAATLNGLLDAEAATATTSGEVEESLTYGYSESGTHGDLVRTAMKAKERDASEERWVCYSEVVETKEESVMELEEESICGGGGGDEEEEVEEDGHLGWCSGGGGGGGKLLALKLDYQEIMEAWSDKGPLYVKGEGPQTVPNLYDGDQMVGSGMWSVPELMVSSGNNEDSLMKNEDWRRGHRLASVLRYKEKRQNRLFAKRIRYEVRKLNAEKRPRMKGRFVKRD